MTRRILVIALAAAAVFAAILGAASPAQDPEATSSPESTPTVIAPAPAETAAPESTTIPAEPTETATQAPVETATQEPTAEATAPAGHARADRHRLPRPRGHGHRDARRHRRPLEGRRSQVADQEDQLRGEGRQDREEVLDLNFTSRLQGREPGS